MAGPFYLDHGAYTAQGDLGANPTTFGVPQEGDGSATTPAAAASVASFDVAGITADAGDTITIAGAVLTCVASGAAANQFNAGTGATLATNIVSAINAATNAVSTSVARNLSNNANQLRNMVFARVTSSTIVEIMFRIGSAQLNHANNSNVAVATAGLSSAPTITQFAGGSGGCFGWFTNVNAIGVSSSIALATYGVFSYPPHVCANGTGVSNYTLLITDRVWCRNNGKTISKSITATELVHGRQHASSLWMTVDSNTIWTGDSASAVFTLRYNIGAGEITIGVNMTSGAANQLILEAVAQHGFRLALGGSSTGSFPSVNWSSTNQNNSLFRNIEVYEDHTSGTNQWTVFGNLITGNTASASVCLNVTFDNLKYTQVTARAATAAASVLALGNSGADSANSIVFNNPIFSFNYTGAGDPTFGLIHGANTLGSIDVTINGGEIISSVTGGFPLITGTNWPNNTHILVHGLKGAKLTTAIAQLQTAQANDGLPWSRQKSMDISLPDKTRSKRSEDIAGVADWIPNQNYPYLNATLPDGTGWSLRALWIATANVLLPGRAFTVPRIVKQFREADAGKIITLKFWCKDALTFDDRNFRVTWLYVDSTGAMRSAITGGSAVVNASDTWSNTGSYAGPTYADKSISLDTDTVSIKQNTEIVAIVSFMGAPSSGSNENLFFDPELTLAAT